MASAASLRGLVMAAAVLSTVSCGNKDPQGGPPPPEVGVITVAERPVPIELSYMARTAGVREVEVRARVSGILLRRLYKEGDRVKEGDLLFRIDPAPYAAEAARARAQVGVEEARAAETQRQLKRNEPLVAQGVVSRREYDESVANAESAAATLAAAKAALRKAQLDLDYTEVRAPISGITSREARSEGSLVNATDDTALLTRISQTEELYIEFSMPVSEAMMVRNTLASADNLQRGAVRVVVQNAEGHNLPIDAKLEFIDTLADESTGTVQARATLTNTNVPLIPGEFVRARIMGLTLPAAVALPSRAILRSAMGAMVWAVNKENKVEPRPVELGQTVGNNTVVTSGVQPGERVIVEGVIKVQPGAPVKPVAAANRPGPNDTSAPPAPPAGH